MRSSKQSGGLHLTILSSQLPLRALKPFLWKALIWTSLYVKRVYYSLDDSLTKSIAPVSEEKARVDELQSPPERVTMTTPTTSIFHFKPFITTSATKQFPMRCPQLKGSRQLIFVTRQPSWSENVDFIPRASRWHARERVQGGKRQVFGPLELNMVAMW